MTAVMEVTVHAVNLLTANQRLHHQQRARATRVLRHAGCVNAHAAGIPRHERAHVTVTVAWPDRRRRDVLNIAPTVKALIDGMTDAGCWPDDDDAHLIGPDFRVSPDRSGLKGVTRLTFTIADATHRPGEEPA